MKPVVPISFPSVHAPADALFERAHACLAAGAVPLLAQWRRRFRPEPLPSARALFAIEQLLLPRPLEPEPEAGAGTGAGSAGKTDLLWEQVHYTAARLAKLGVPLRQVTAAFDLFRPLAAAWLEARLRPWAAEALGALEGFHQRLALAAAQAYVEVQSAAVDALLAVLDAELNAADLDELLQRLLSQAAQVFPIHWGEILLLDEEGEAPRLRHRALYGVDPGLLMPEAGVGTFFQRVAREGVPGFVLDAANDPRVAQPYYRMLEVKSVWAAPLLRRRRENGEPEALGVLAVAFDRAYECLPQERELLLALAERSTMAIERTRMAESLGREQARVLELSRRVLDAQDEERRRISRDLHDETGQALLALRLYLELGLRHRPNSEVRQWIERGLDLVDGSVADLRRILAQLSPLMLDELGLEAAVRLDLRRLRGLHGWRARFHYADRGERLSRPMETLVYRLALEGLHNVARHARARRVELSIVAGPGRLCLRLSDDGVGMAGLQPTLQRAARERHFGLAGMRERVRLAGGELKLATTPGQGVRLEIDIPLAAPPAPAAAAIPFPAPRAAVHSTGN